MKVCNCTVYLYNPKACGYCNTNWYNENSIFEKDWTYIPPPPKVEKRRVITEKFDGEGKLVERIVEEEI